MLRIALTRRYLLGAVALMALLISACARAPQALSPGQWRAFDGTWIAAGSRNTMHLAGDRTASVGDYSGSLVLNGPSRPAAGFRAEALVLDDTETGGVGRADWVDENGDHVYSELREVVAPAGNKIIGTFIGGTGRWAGAEGTYEFAWQFLVETGDGTVQGQSTGLKGRIRIGSSRASAITGGPQS